MSFGKRLRAAAVLLVIMALIFMPGPAGAA
jgi:hypothetical protein